jgi:hypothetical protein
MPKMAIMACLALLLTADLASAESAMKSGRPSQVLTSDQCNEVWTEAVTKSEPAQADTSPDINFALVVADFAQVDTNSDGTVDKEEFMAACGKGLVHEAPGQYDDQPMPRVEKSPQVSAPRAEISRTRYQQYTWNESCGEQPICRIDFDVVPANSRLEITNVSCYVNLRGPNTANIILRVPQLHIIGTGGTVVTASTLAPTVLHSGDRDEIIWTANHAVDVFADAGQHIQGFFQRHEFDTVGNRWKIIACHISGHLVKLQ